MRFSIPERLSKKLVINGIIPSDDKEIYAYGIRQLFLVVLNITTTLIIGSILNMMVESLAFTIAYVPLRTYTGGYHAKTQIRCYLFSIFIITTVLLVMREVKMSYLICFIIIVIAGVIILILAPMEDKNKPLNENEYKIYKRYSVIILCVLMFIAVALLIMNNAGMLACVSMAILVSACMLVLGKSIKIKC